MRLPQNDVLFAVHLLIFPFIPWAQKNMDARAITIFSCVIYCRLLHENMEANKNNEAKSIR